MASAHNKRAAEASRRGWYREDPRVYIRIAGVLRERIAAGDLAPGQATPSITRLCADHGVARETAAHALHILQDAGLVYRVPGLGYHVCNGGLSYQARTADALQSLQASSFKECLSITS
jgi:DNA-binding GntR family transcriptional regulator